LPRSTASVSRCPPKRKSSPEPPPNPNDYDEDAYHEAATKLHAAVLDLWRAGATAQAIEDEVEDAMRDAGVEE
jgi:hypothetical protein